jgi:hypothetical protein
MPGHAMVYELRRSSSAPGKFQMAIYNVGLGLQYHATRVVAGMETASSLVIDEIDPSRLADSIFLSLLDGFSQRCPFGHDWDEEDVYHAVVSALRGNVVGSEALSYSDIQRSGTCPFASYFAFLHRCMSEKDCGRLRIALGIKCIQRFLQDVSIISADLVADRNLALIEKSITNFSRQLLQAETEGWIDRSDVVVIQRYLSDFRAQTQKLREELSRKSCCLSPVVDRVAEDPEKLELEPSRRLYDGIGPKVTYKSPSAKKIHSSAELSPPCNLSTVSEIKETVSKTIEWARLQKLKGNEYEATFEIARLSVMLAEAFRQNADQLAHLDEGVRAELMEHLHELGEMYVRFHLSFASRAFRGIPSDPTLPSTVIHLIGCAIVLTREVKLIEAHRTNLWEAFQFVCSPFYSRFEFYSDEEAFARTADVQHKKIMPPLERGVGTDVLSKVFILYLKDLRSKANPFIELILSKYGEAIQAVTGQCAEDEIVARAISFKEREKLKNVLPPEFFHFLDLISLVPFLVVSQGQVGRNLLTASDDFVDDPLSVWQKSDDWDFFFDLHACKLSFPKIPENVFRSYEDPPPFSLEDVVDPFIKGQSHSEGGAKRLSSSYIATLKPPSDDVSSPFKELRLILCEPDFQIDTALATFASYPSLLSQKGWQNFLEAALFSQRTLQNVCDKSPLKNTPAVISDFLKKHLDVSLAPPRNLDVAIFLLRLYRRLFERSSLMAKDQAEILKKEIASWFDSAYQQVIQLPEDQRGALLLKLKYERACFLNCQKILTDEEIEILVESVITVRRNSGVEGKTLEYNICTLTHSVFGRDDVQRRLGSEMSSLINLSMGNPGSSRVWQREGQTLFVSNDVPPLRYELLVGEVETASGQTIVEPPPALFSSERLREAINERVPSVVIKIDAFTFSFDVRGVNFRVEIKDNVLSIYKFVDECWYQLIENSALESRHVPEREALCPVQLALREGMHVWYTEDAQTYRLRIESKDGVLKYTASGEKPQQPQTCEVREVKGDVARVILPPEALPGLLLEVEDPEYIIARSDDGNRISSISFPRFGSDGLTFVFDPATQKFRNSKNRDEILLADQYFRGTPRLKHKLVVKDEKTQKKRVLIPGHQLDVGDKLHRSALDTGSDLSLSNPESSIALYSYRKEKDRLVPETTEGALYLVYTYLWQQQYEEAAHVLESIPQLPLSEEAIKTLQWIVKGDFSDRDPDSIAVRLKAAAVLARQRELFHHDVKCDYEDLWKEYQSCSHLCTNVFLLSDEALILGQNPGEIKIPVAIRSGCGVPIYSKFRDSLYLSSYTPAPMPTEHILNPSFSRSSFADLCLGLVCLRGCSQMQWEEIRGKIFNVFGTWLAEDSQGEVEKLKRILSIAATSKKGPAQAASTILLAILENPEKFRECDDIFRKLKYCAWEDNDEDLKKLLVISQSILDERHSIPMAGPRGVEEVVFGSSLTRAGEGLVALEGDAMQVEVAPIDDSSQVPLEANMKGVFGEGEIEMEPSASELYALSVRECIKDSSPIAMRTCTDLVSAASGFVEQTGARVVVCIDKDHLHRSMSEIQTESDTLKADIKKDRRKIRDLLSTMFGDEVLRSRQAVIGAAKMVRGVSIQDAVYALVAPFPGGFLQLNPALTAEQATELRRVTIEYLVHKTRQQHLQEVLHKGSELDRKPNPSQEEIQELHELFLTARGYRPEQSPELLVFEDAFGHFLRPEQIEILRDFLSGNVGSESKVMELIMAFGKTSVLMPIILYFIAQKGRLAFGVIPPNLYASMAPQIARSLQEGFSTQVFSWQLKPNEEVSYQELKCIDRGLKNAVAFHQVVLVRPEEITGLFLQCISILQMEQTEERVKKIERLQSIFTLMATNGSFLFDEVHALWDVLREHLMSISSLKPIDVTTLHTSTILLWILAKYPMPAKADQFREQISPLLIKEFLDILAESEDPDIKKIVAQERECILAYLQRECPKSKIAHLPRKVRDMLAAAYTQIHDVLPTACTEVLGTHYGIQPSASLSEPYAVPYLDGKPAVGFRSGDDLEEIDHTILMYAQSPPDLMLPYIIPYVHHLRSEVHRELAENPRVKIEETDAGREIRSTFGETIAQRLLTCDQSECERVLIDALTLGELTPDAMIVEGAIPFKLSLIERFILPKIVRPNRYARTTSQMFGVLCNSLMGFSGTLWNKETYPVPSKPSTETVGRTLSILSRENQHVTVLRSGDVAELFKPNQGIIDAGGVLKNKGGREVAQRILDSCDETIQGVVYHNEEDIPRILDREGRDHPYPSKELFAPETLTAFWSQAFFTGADFKIRANASCSIYFGKDTLDSQFFQAIWRLRKFGKGQHVSVVISEETEQLIRSKFRLDPLTPVELRHVVAFGLVNKIERQSSDNYRAFKHKVDAILQKGFLDLVLRSGSEGLPEALEVCKDLFISEKPESPFDAYGERQAPVETQPRLEEIVKGVRESKAFAYLVEKGVLDPKEFDRKISDIMVMREVLPDSVLDSPSDLGTRVQMQTSTQTRTQTQTQTKVVAAGEGIETRFPETNTRFMEFVYCQKFDEYIGRLTGDAALHMDFVAKTASHRAEENVELAPMLEEGIPDPYFVYTIDDSACGVFRLKEIFKFRDSVADLSEIIPDDVGTTLNVHPIQSKTFTPLTINAKPIELALYVRGSHGQSMVALDQHEACRISEEGYFLDEIKEGRIVAVVNVHSGVIYSLGKNPVPQSLGDDIDFLIDRVALKVFAGDVNLSRKEQLALFARCAQLGEHGFEKMAKYLQEYVCIVHPHAQAYTGGLLHMLEDRGVNLIRNTISQLEVHYKDNPPLLEQVQALKAEVEHDATSVYSAGFIGRLMAIEAKRD